MIKEALFWEKLDENRGQCHLCAHECRIPESKFGICGVRQNIRGVLHTMVYADVIAANIDPIEKKPLYHFLPGSLSYSIATIGCNFKCGFCQNWQISQASIKEGPIVSRHQMMPEQVVETAKKNNCSSISYTYTEPTIFFEYAYDTARLAKKAGLSNVFVTNGYMTRQALETIKPYLDAANVDLKSFREDSYQKNCKARLQPVLDTIAAMKELDIWLEVTTLVIPGENDSNEELGLIAEFLARIDLNIPWHISRFHPDYEFHDHKDTPMETLKRAREIGQRAGLRYIYLGNVLEGANTSCHQCRELIADRRYMGLNKLYLENGRCPSCGAKINGVWS
ncbi:MAG: AmmeMemoRadiSam system radical SAM enzyme [Syntrophales bacterium]|nr:AmmeMemoRadiSam system radical SAM enzyme [Syntrophales bacterium]